MPFFLLIYLSPGIVVPNSGKSGNAGFQVHYQFIILLIHVLE